MAIQSTVNKYSLFFNLVTVSFFVSASYSPASPFHFIFLLFILSLQKSCKNSIKNISPPPELFVRCRPSIISLEYSSMYLPYIRTFFHRALTEHQNQEINIYSLLLPNHQTLFRFYQLSQGYPSYQRIETEIFSCIYCHVYLTGSFLVFP